MIFGFSGVKCDHSKFKVGGEQLQDLVYLACRLEKEWGNGILTTGERGAGGCKQV